MIRVACPHCAKPLGLPPTVAGKTVKCPNCKNLFAAPAAKGAPAKAAPQKAASPANAQLHPEDEEATPYGVKTDEPVPASVAKSANLEAVDEMVITARRTRKRNKAWDAVGLPAKWIKRDALTMVVLWLLAYLFMTMVIVLANHNMEVAEKSGGFVMSGGVKEKPKYLFIGDVFGIAPTYDGVTRPLFLWLLCTGVVLVAFLIYGLQLAGAESMKRLENYGLVTISMIVGALTINLFCIWGLLVIMSADVKYEFRVSARRQQGLSGEELYNEDLNEDEDEDEEDEEEEDEEEEEETPRTAKRR